MKISFSFRVKMGQMEIEISGTREDVMKTIEKLLKLIETVSKASGAIKNREETKSVSSFFSFCLVFELWRSCFSDSYFRVGQAPQRLN